jgi:uncharacterized membrane protein
LDSFISMLSQITHIKLLLENFEEKLKTDYELIKLRAVDKSADMVSAIFSFVVIIVCCIIFILILSFGLSFWVGRLLGNIELGFFAIAGLWGIICAIMYLARKKWIKTPSQDVIVKKILD